jgi:hypothetical protein
LRGESFCFSFGPFQVLIAADLFSAVRRDAENCASRSLEQFNLKPKSWERSSSAEGNSTGKARYGHKVIRRESVL